MFGKLHKERGATLKRELWLVYSGDVTGLGRHNFIWWLNLLEHVPLQKGD